MDTHERLERYHDILLKWQEKINLISPNTVQDAWKRHFEDSIQLEKLIPATAKTLYDLGSGAGFPGLVLAILRPDISVTLIESDSKKCAFLQTVSRETNLPVSVITGRIELMAATLPAPNAVTARALAPLETLFSYCAAWTQKQPDLTLVFPKGTNRAVEINDAKKAGWAFNLTETPSVTDSSAAILTLTNLRKTSV